MRVHKALLSERKNFEFRFTVQRDRTLKTTLEMFTHYCSRQTVKSVVEQEN